MKSSLKNSALQTCSKSDACLCLVWKDIPPIQVNWLPLSLKEKHGFSYFPHPLPQNENLHNMSHFNELTGQISVETELKAKQSSTSSIWESLGRRPTVAHERGCYQLLSPWHEGTLQSPKTGQCLCKIQETDAGTGHSASACRQTAVCLEKPAPMKFRRCHWLVQDEVSLSDPSHS